MQKAEKHIPVLDAVRGLAIVLVLIYHFLAGIPFPHTFLGRAAEGFIQSAWTGVDLFFVLSGFLITGILYDTRESGNYFPVFYARRFLRIFPLYYGFLFIILAFTRPLHIEWGGRQFFYLAYLQNTGLGKHIFSKPLSPFININHLWSLAVEEQFYCVWPAAVFLLKDRIRLMWLAVILSFCSIGVRILMILYHAPLGTIYTFTPAPADSLMIGALLALALRSSHETQSKLARGAWFVLPGSVVILVGLAWRYQRLNWESSATAICGFPVIAVASAALITLSLKNPLFQATFNWSAMRWLGKYSYGIYVLHYPVLTLFQSLDLPAHVRNLNGELEARLLTLSTSAVVSIGLAALSFHFYENRFLRLKKYFRYNDPDSPHTPDRGTDEPGAQDAPQQSRSFAKNL